MPLEVTLSEPARILGARLQAVRQEQIILLVHENASPKWVAEAVNRSGIVWRGFYRLRFSHGDVPGLVGIINEPGTKRRAVALVWWDNDAGRWGAATSLGSLRGSVRIKSEWTPVWANARAATRDRRQEPQAAEPSRSIPRPPPPLAVPRRAASSGP